MFFVMGVSIYTSRVVLDVLGVDDYGLYSVIAGIVILLSILNNSMISATQRFLTFELGKSDYAQVSRTFSMSMTAHIGIALLLLVIGETLGVWYLHNFLSIPAGREGAANWIYHLSMAILFVTIIRSPYNASIISYERMSFFAIASILETSLKLGIVYLLAVSQYDKLISYVALLFVVEILMTVMYWRYCKIKFNTCNYTFFIDRPYFRKLLGFLGWNLLGGVATLGTQQAGNLILNAFYGVAVNAAFGLSYQVSNALNQFVTNFQTAFRPQIIKLYSCQKMDEFYSLINRSALMSYYLLFIVSFPLFIYIHQVLGFWLKEVPDYSAGLCQILILTGLMDSLQAPLWIGISATGNIKNYQLVTSFLFIMNIPLSYVLMKYGYSPYWVLIIRLIIGIVMSVYRMFLCKRLFGFSISRYTKEVLFRISASTISIYLLWILLREWIRFSDLWGFIPLYFCIAIVSSFIIFFWGINRNDRLFLLSIAKSKLHI